MQGCMELDFEEPWLGFLSLWGSPLGLWLTIHVPTLTSRKRFRPGGSSRLLETFSSP